MLKKRKEMFVLIGFTIMFCIQAYGSLLEDGFESVPATPDFTGDYDPDSSVWETGEDYASSIMVFSKTTSGAETSWIHSGNQAVRFKGAGARQLSASYAPQTSVIVTFQAYIPDINKGFRTLNFNLRNSTGTLIGPNLSFYDQTIKYHDGSNWYDITNFVTDRYAEVTVYADAATKKFTLKYDGVLYDNGGAGYDFYGTPGNLGQIYFSFSQNYREAYLDDILVDVPEPATFGLLILGMFGLIRKK